MPRVKRGTTAHKRRKNVLKDAKGFMWTRHSKFRQAKEALLHAWSFQFNDRRKKKGVFRRLWQIRIGAATRLNDIPYNVFIHGLKTHNIEVDRKILSDLVEHNPEVFKQILDLSQAK